MFLLLISSRARCSPQSRDTSLVYAVSVHGKFQESGLPAPVMRMEVLLAEEPDRSVSSTFTVTATGTSGALQRSAAATLTVRSLLALCSTHVQCVPVFRLR
jgi:hypothetical protein